MIFQHTHEWIKERRWLEATSMLVAASLLLSTDRLTAEGTAGEQIAHGGATSPTTAASQIAPEQSPAAGPIVSNTPANWARVSAGAGYSLFVEKDGSVSAWGLNDSCQLGLGDTTPRLAPTRISRFTDIFQISAGITHSLAVGNDGKAYAWGNNAFGQTGANRHRLPFVGYPHPVPGLPHTIVKVAAGESHSLALDRSGRIWAWGNNASGQLARDPASLSERETPLALESLLEVRDIAAGRTHCLVLLSDGSVHAWGGNEAGQAGVKASVPKILAPVKVVSGGAVAVAAGRNHSLALMSDGSVLSWGAVAYIGRHIEEDAPTHTPGKVTNSDREGLGNIVSIAAGAGHSFAITDAGAVWGWGRADTVRLPHELRKDHPLAELNVDLEGIAAIATGSHAESSHTLALNSDGTLLSFGAAFFGQLGDGSSKVRVDHGLPRPIVDADGDGMADWWERENTLDPEKRLDADLDSDADGYTNANEFLDGTDPTDTYSFAPRTMAITSGDAQENLPNTFLENALKVKVLNPDGTPAGNIAVHFQGKRGLGRVAATKGGAKARTMVARTDAAGVATIFYELPTGTQALEDAPVVARVGKESVTFAAKINYNLGPTAPAEVKTQYLSGTETLITWVDRSDDETAFVVKRSLQMEEWEVVATLPPDTTSFKDSTGSDGPPYVYRVQAAGPN